jgi:membrane fusion protein (multidrug efflux system)
MQHDSTSELDELERVRNHRDHSRGSESYLDRDPEPEEESPEENFDRESNDEQPGPSLLQRIKQRPRLIPILLVVMAGLAVAALRFWHYLESYENTDDAQVSAYIDPISSRVDGTIIGVYVHDDQAVNAGQLLAQLDPRDYQVAVEQARAQVGEAVANANSARQQYVAALATVRQAQAQNHLAQVNAKRYAYLLQLQVASKESYDQSQATARTDAATVASDQAAAVSAERTIASREAQVQAAQAALNQAELNLSYTQIKAPADGIIGNRNADLGQRVQPGQSLMALTQMNDLWVTANFKETQLEQMYPGQKVTIHVDALGRDFKGTVQSMPGATGSLYDLLPPENATGNYVKVVQRLPVRIIFDSGQDLSKLRPGMSVEPSVWLK